MTVLSFEETRTNAPMLYLADWRPRVNVRFHLRDQRVHSKQFPSSKVVVATFFPEIGHGKTNLRGWCNPKVDDKIPPHVTGWSWKFSWETNSTLLNQKGWNVTLYSTTGPCHSQPTTKHSAFPNSSGTFIWKNNFLTSANITTLSNRNRQRASVTGAVRFGPCNSRSLSEVP